MAQIFFTSDRAGFTLGDKPVLTPISSWRVMDMKSLWANRDQVLLIPHFSANEKNSWRPIPIPKKTYICLTNYVWKPQHLVTHSFLLPSVILTVSFICFQGLFIGNKFLDTALKTHMYIFDSYSAILHVSYISSHIHWLVWWKNRPPSFNLTVAVDIIICIYLGS